MLRLIQTGPNIWHGEYTLIQQSLKQLKDFEEINMQMTFTFLTELFYLVSWIKEHIINLNFIYQLKNFKLANF